MFYIAIAMGNNDKTITLKENYAKDCDLTITLTYQKVNLKTFPYAKAYMNYINLYKRFYFEYRNPKKMFSEDDIFDYCYDTEVDKHYYEDVHIYLTAITPQSYSIGIYANSYAGEANTHQNDFSATQTLNPLDNSPFAITYDEIVTNQKALKKIALKEYKKQRHFKKGDTLEKDTWYENKFKLPQNFSLFKDGLMLNFTEYVWDKSLGSELNIFIPYSEIKSILKKNFLKTLLKKDFYHFKNRYFSTKIAFKKIKEKLLVTVYYKLKKSYKKAWLSLSFPQFSTEKGFKLIKSSFTKITFYHKGKKIYNKEKNKNINAKYLLLEGELSKAKKAFLQFKMPLKNFVLINFRTTIKGKKIHHFPIKNRAYSFIINLPWDNFVPDQYPKEFEKVKFPPLNSSYITDQQGYPIYELFYFKNTKKFFVERKE